MLNKRLAELLVKEELLNQDDVEEVMKAAESEQKRVIDILIERGLTDEAALIQFFSKQYRLPVVDLSNFDMDDRMVDLVPRALCLKHKIVPIGKRGETLVIAVSDPSNIQALDDIKFQTRMKLEQSLALPSSINMIMERSFGVDIDRLSEELGAKNESAGELLLDENQEQQEGSCLLYTSPSPRD